MEVNIRKVKMGRIFILLLFLGSALSQEDDLDKTPEIKIGAIIYTNSTELEMMVRLASEINQNNTIRLKPIIKEVAYGSIREAENHVCQLAEEGVYGIIDTTTGRTSSHIQSVCDSLEIPHIITNHNYLQTSNWSAVNLYPNAATYNEMLINLTKIKEWQNFTIMYVKGYTISRMNRLLELNSLEDSYTVTVRELSGDNYRPAFAAAKKRESVNFLIDCPTSKLEQVLRQAQEVGLMSNKHSYIITSPDLHTVDLEQFKYGGANITGFRMMDPKAELVQGVMSRIENTTLLTSMYLLYDAVKVLEEAYEKLKVQPTSLSCSKTNTWRHGSSVINIMRTNQVKGLSGEIAFDSDGQRANFTFDVFELTRFGLTDVAKWKDELQITRKLIKLSNDDGGIMTNKTFTVLIAMIPPYAFLKDTVNELSGNERYEGFAIDIIEELSQKLGFNYKLVEAEKIGDYENDKPTGMVKKIIDNEADFGIADFTVTPTRSKVLDFTSPFMSVGISILYKQPSKQPPAMFSFMDPFAKEVWIYMLLAQLVLGVLIVFVGRLSHKEWHNPFPCVEQPESLDNQFSYANAVWLIIGSVMQQGSEIAPIALGSRTITSAWWFFTMVIISSYTGTLVSFLVNESNDLPFKNADELSKQTSIDYGAVKNGATIKFFQYSGKEVYKRMYTHMSRKECFNCPKDNTEGREKVQSGRYAFFMESAGIEYELERNCDLMKVGDLLDSKNYGIGMMKNSPYREAMSKVILEMKETGAMQKLKDKWWKERRGGGACTDDDNGGEKKQLEMKNMIGAFVVLGVGLIVGILISVLDMLWGVYKKTIKFDTSFRYELVEELCFALKFSGDTKPVKKRPQAAAGVGDPEGELEARDALESLRSIGSGSSGDTHRTRHSHCTHRSSRSQSVAFARRRRYS